MSIADSIVGIALIATVTATPATSGIFDWLVEDEAEKAARLACEDQQKSALAREYALSSLEDTRLCLQGIRTDRFDPAIYCGADLTFPARVARYKRLLDDMAPSLYSDCP